ncbi:MAG: LysR family transcriptional regulator [Bacillati bacterium ANGP1]|uniref:LysR family transcriptional regulator n=1 Tax=Candidatus Segetimicrobium genomatis TaxID=2569760 RepID=A0A537JYY0_9BACT|nr:MAG: LysR family transcriptional regulator [Terrabacteria group bacterium ANGP1]
MAINVHQLKIFHTVARSGSFSRAAAELLISQPSVSIQVGDLERQFGTDLFEQVGKHVRLTEAGRVLDGYAARILALIDETRVAMDEVKGLRRGRLLLGATPTPGTYLLPALLGRFKEQYPSIEISLRLADTRRIQEMLLQHQLDLGVIGGSVSFPDLEAAVLLNDELVLVVAPSHPFAALPSVRVADLAGEPFILRERGSGNREAADEALHRAGVHVTPVFEVEGAEMVKQAVAANLGISILSRCAVELEVAAGRLRIVPIEGLRIERAISLLSRRDPRLPRVAQAFLEMIRPQALTRPQSDAIITAS